MSRENVEKKCIGSKIVFCFADPANPEEGRKANGVGQADFSWTEGCCSVRGEHPVHPTCPQDHGCSPTCLSSEVCLLLLPPWYALCGPETHHRHAGRISLPHAYYYSGKTGTTVVLFTVQHADVLT